MKVIFALVLLIAAVAAQKDLWSQLDRAPSDLLVKFTLALPQQNLDALESTLLDVSDPTSANYGKWWTLEQIQKLVSPPAAVANRVIAFLHSHGITEIVNRQDSLKVTARVQDIETIFQTKLYFFEHKIQGTTIVRATQMYTLPEELNGDVDLVAGLLEFPQLRDQQWKTVDGQAPTADAQGFVVPAFINSLYQIPTNFPVNASSSLCLAEFQNNQAFLASDNSNFTTQNDLPAFNITHVVGPLNGTQLESVLDIEFGGAIGQTTPLWYWTEEEWMYEFSVALVNTPNPPLVVSMSWGWPEPDQCQIDNCNGTSFDYVERTNVEFQKAGMLGITLLAASGDQGAPGDGNPSCGIFTKDKLSTIFPGASPWVLSVGATMLTQSTPTKYTPPPVCQDHACTDWTNEVVCTIPEAIITTGGGFSNYVPTPSYQKTVVSKYLNSGVKLPPAKYFNATNRGFPDVAALGHAYLIMMDGTWTSVDGTSCSTPVWGGIISLLNSYRLNNGKSSLGFVIPALYQAYAADATTFNDITSGDNHCTESCCRFTYGYQATAGWDPVTGLGTPVFPKLLKYVASLP